MILDTQENSERYEKLHPQFARAFRWLRETDFSSLPDGKHAIEGDELFVIVARSDGRGREASPLEAHRRYADIQFVIEGEDEIGWLPLSHCWKRRHAFNTERDIVFFDDVPNFYAPLKAGHFAIFFPGDAHAPLAGTGAVRKAVVKIEMNP